MVKAREGRLVAHPLRCPFASSSTRQGRTSGTATEMTECGRRSANHSWIGESEAGRPASERACTDGFLPAVSLGSQEKRC